MCDVVLHKRCTLLYYSCLIIEGASWSVFSIISPPLEERTVTATHDQLAQG